MAHTKAGCTALTMAAGEGRAQAIVDLFLEGFEDHNSDERHKRDKMKELANTTEDPCPQAASALYLPRREGMSTWRSY